MNEVRDDFLDSLDLDDSEIIPFIPEILKNLWGLGSMPEYVIHLVEKHIPSNKLKRIIDLGCGKGSVLIQLSEKIKFEGIGIDLMSEFIDEAKRYASRHSYSENLKFEVGDIKKMVEHYCDFDLVIYAHDSDIFGNVTQSLCELEKYMLDQSWIVFEGLYNINQLNNPENLPNKEEFHLQLEKSGFEVINQIVWDKDELRKTNQTNTKLIRDRITHLIQSHPDKEKLFNTYLENQIEECQELEENIECLTLLLKRKRNTTMAKNT